MAKAEVDVQYRGDVERGYVRLELESGVLQGWWEVAGGRGGGYGRIDAGGTGMTEVEAEAALDGAVEEYWQGSD
jgi:hypothetical protein